MVTDENVPPHDNSTGRISNIVNSLRRQSINKIVAVASAISHEPDHIRRIMADNLHLPVPNTEFKKARSNVEWIVNIARKKLLDVPVECNLNKKSESNESNEDKYINHIRTMFKFYLISSSTLAISEPFIVPYHPTGSMFVAQVVVLAISTVLFFVGQYLTILCMPRVVYFIKPTPQETEYAVVNRLPLPCPQVLTSEPAHGDFTEVPLSFLRMFFESLDRLALAELIPLVFGWGCIFTSPGIAALRCFRVFRFLWFLDFYKFGQESYFYALSCAAHKCVVILERFTSILVDEFSLSPKSSGGMLVLCECLFLCLFCHTHADWFLC